MATERKELARTAQTVDPQDLNSSIRVRVIAPSEFGQVGDVLLLSASVARAAIRDGQADPV
jgi:hypothetical protein